MRIRKFLFTFLMCFVLLFMTGLSYLQRDEVKEKQKSIVITNTPAEIPSKNIDMFIVLALSIFSYLYIGFYSAYVMVKIAHTDVKNVNETLSIKTHPP